MELEDQEMKPLRAETSCDGQCGSLLSRTIMLASEAAKAFEQPEASFKELMQFLLTRTNGREVSLVVVEELKLFCEYLISAVPESSLLADALARMDGLDSLRFADVQKDILLKILAHFAEKKCCYDEVEVKEDIDIAVIPPPSGYLLGVFVTMFVWRQVTREGHSLLDVFETVCVNADFEYRAFRKLLGNCLHKTDLFPRDCKWIRETKTYIGDASSFVRVVSLIARIKSEPRGDAPNAVQFQVHAQWHPWQVAVGRAEGAHRGYEV